MAKLCTSCGNPLPRDDSRFCNNCGAAFSNRSSSSAPRPTKVISGEEASTPAYSVMREQIAFAAPPRPVPTETPAWMSKLDTMGNRSLNRPRITDQRSATPSKVPIPPSNASSALSQTDSPLPPRELLVRVWEDSEISRHEEPGTQQNGHTRASQNERKSGEMEPAQDMVPVIADEDSEVENLPTTPLLSTIVPEKEQNLSPGNEPQGQDSDRNDRPDMEERWDADLPTRPLPASQPVQNAAPARRPAGRPFPAQTYRQSPPSQAPARQPADRQRQDAPVQPAPVQPPVVQRPVTPALPVSYPGFQQAAPVPANEQMARATRPARRASRMRVVIVLVMLVVLAAGGLIYWITAYQPFNVPAVTQTSLAFQNVNLGVAVQYPQGWTAKLDAAHQTVAFFDTNHTDQANIVVAATNGSSVDAYVKKEAAQLGLTAQKNLPPLPFAGTNWQQVQGSVLVSGASYTETLLVALHGDRFYSLVQMAPAATYGDADHLFFAILRSSWRFL